MRTNFRIQGGNHASELLKRYRAEEEGSLTIFSLFIFLMILIVSGVAIDMMRYEHQRVGVQTTLDTAVVAASSLTQTAETDEEVNSLVKDYFAKAGYDPDIVTVAANIERPAGSPEVTARSIAARVDFDYETAFMNMIGFDELPGIVGAGAFEGMQMVEISIVLDVSGSMGDEVGVAGDTKMSLLHTAAKDFVTTILSNNTPARTIISIIPYSDQVLMNNDLMTRLTPGMNLDPVLIELPADAHPGALASYIPGNPNTRCARFREDDYETPRLVASEKIELMGHFSDSGSESSNTPTNSNRWCQIGDRVEMLLYQNDETILHDFIDTLTPGGWTAIDYGMNWGVGVLDPSFQNVVTGMIADGLAPASAAGSPVNYDTGDVKKYVVVMTDGINTMQKDLKDDLKFGATRVWFSQTLADAGDGNWDGYLVEMPERSSDQRWYKPESPGSSSDDAWVTESNFPADAVQLDHNALFQRFHRRFIGDYFFERYDEPTHDVYSDAIDDELGYGKADTRLLEICSAAKDDEWFEVYTVAFDAPDDAEDVLEACSLKFDADGNPDNSNHFNVVGTQISDAFAAIAADITRLRLTQ